MLNIVILAVPLCHGHRKNEAYYLHIKFGKEDISYDSKRYSNSYFCNMAADRLLGFCESRTCRVLLTTFSPPKMSPPLGLTNDVGIASYCSESVKLSVRQKSSPRTFDATPAMAVTLMGREHIRRYWQQSTSSTTSRNIYLVRPHQDPSFLDPIGHEAWRNYSTKKPILVFRIPSNLFLKPLILPQSMSL